ncbi:MAG TPA: zf-HC2 domain-containing protein [Thermoanaerobaculia bacterium]|nr:zf-HC2 domain-containing protein [Thermoanaerobaculia bacterium]
MDCKKVGDSIYLFFDNELDQALLTPFRHHVDGCGDCAKRVDYTRRLLLLVRASVRCSAPDRLRLRILTNMPHRGGIERSV